MFGKKTYGMTWVAAVLLLASAGCVQIEQVGTFSDIPMSFSTYTPHTTKAAGAPGPVGAENKLPANSSFGVFAFYQEGVIDSGTPALWSSSRTPNFMFDQQVDFDGTDYSYGPTRYWPANDENRISFWAYWPYEYLVPNPDPQQPASTVKFFDPTNNSGPLKLYDKASYQSNPATANVYNSSSQGLPVVKYSVSATPTQQYDLLFDSFAQKDRGYDIIGNPATAVQTPGTVPLTFRHALSLVQFNIKPNGQSLPEGAQIRITSFELTNIYMDGTCMDPSASVAYDPQNSILDAASYWTVDYTTPVDITLASGTMTNNLILMPQELAGEGTPAHAKVKLTMTYDIVFPAAHPDLPELSYKNNTVTDAYLWKKDNGGDFIYGVDRWAPGCKYVYNIEVGLERIEFSEVVETSWTSEWPTP